MITIPLTPPDVVARIELPHPLTDEEWKQFNLVLFAMHPGLVERAADSNSTGLRNTGKSGTTEHHNPGPHGSEAEGQGTDVPDLDDLWSLCDKTTTGFVGVTPDERRWLLRAAQGVPGAGNTVTGDGSGTALPAIECDHASCPDEGCLIAEELEDAVLRAKRMTDGSSRTDGEG